MPSNGSQQNQSSPPTEKLDSRKELITSKSLLYQSDLGLNKPTMERILVTLEEHKTNLMPLHDLKSMLEIEVGKGIENLKKSARGLLESDLFSISSDPIEFYFGFFNLMNGLYAPTTPPPSTDPNSKPIASNLLKLPKSPIHYLDMDCIRVLVQFMLQMDVTHFTTGLTFLCKSLVEDLVIVSPFMNRNGLAHGKGKDAPSCASTTPLTAKEEAVIKVRLASALSNQALIQIIAMAFPDMFFGRNEVDAPESPAKQVFANYQKHLSAGKGVGNVLLWICCQQSFAMANGRRVVHPKCLEIWFTHFYPLFSVNISNTWDKKCAMNFIDVVLDNLIKQPNMLQYDTMDLAVIPMPTFSSIFNVVFLQTPSHSTTQSQSLEKIYRKLKHLMFLSDRAKVITSPPLQILTTLLAPLPHLSKSTGSYQECVDLLANLLSSDQLLPGYAIPTSLGQEMINSWVTCFGDYTKETAILVEYLIEKSKPGSFWSGSSAIWTKLKKSGLSKGVQKIADRNRALVRSFKKTQPHLAKLQPRLTLLAKLARPPASFTDILLKTFLQTFLLVLTVFLFYSLVYVQCGKEESRVCPLAFDPHATIDSLRIVSLKGYDFIQSSVDSVKGHDVWNRSTAYFQTIWNPFVAHCYVLAKKGWELLPRDVSTFINLSIEKASGYYESSGFEKMAYWVFFRVKSDFEMARQYWNYFTSSILPEWIELFLTIWHLGAVAFVDKYLPLMVDLLNQALEYGEEKGKWMVEFIVEYGNQFVKSSFANQIRQHWISVTIHENYIMHVDPILSQFWLMVSSNFQVLYLKVMEIDWSHGYSLIEKAQEKIQSIIQQ